VLAGAQRSRIESVRSPRRRVITVGDALAELLADITQAAGTIGTMLQDMGRE
jgi:hypothetical protein